MNCRALAIEELLDPRDLAAAKERAAEAPPLSAEARAILVALYGRKVAADRHGIHIDLRLRPCPLPPNPTAFAVSTDLAEVTG